MFNHKTSPQPLFLFETHLLPLNAHHRGQRHIAAGHHIGHHQLNALRDQPMEAVPLVAQLHAIAQRRLDLLAQLVLQLLHRFQAVLGRRQDAAQPPQVGARVPAGDGRLVVGERRRGRGGGRRRCRIGG